MVIRLTEKGQHRQETKRHRIYRLQACYQQWMVTGDVSSAFATPDSRSHSPEQSRNRIKIASAERPRVNIHLPFEEQRFRLHAAHFKGNY